MITKTSYMHMNPEPNILAVVADAGRSAQEQDCTVPARRRAPACGASSNLASARGPATPC